MYRVYQNVDVCMYRVYQNVDVCKYRVYQKNALNGTIFTLAISSARGGGYIFLVFYLS